MGGSLRPRLAAAVTAPPRAVVSAGAAIAATVLALFSAGTWPVLALLLAVVAWNLATAGAAALAAAATTVRLGSPALGAAAGMQTVFGPAVFVRPAAAGLGAAVTGAALVVAPRTRTAAVPFGLSAALVVAGPSGATTAGLVVRVVAAIACVELAWAASHRWNRLASRRDAIVVGCAAVGLALAVFARPAGMALSPDWRDAARGSAMAAAAVVVTVVVALVLRRRRAGTVDA